MGLFSLIWREFFFEDIIQYNYFVQVIFNIWGIKFKIVGLVVFLLINFGVVIYKISLLYFQFWQMIIYFLEVRKIFMDYINLFVFNLNVFSEDEDDLLVIGVLGVFENNLFCIVNIFIVLIYSFV